MQVFVCNAIEQSTTYLSWYRPNKLADNSIPQTGICHLSKSKWRSLELIVLGISLVMEGLII